MEERMQALIGARIREFKRKAAEVKAIARTIPNKVVVEVQARTKKFYSRLTKIATTLRSFGEIGQQMVGGVLLSSFSSLIPILASVAAGIGALGPMLGVAAGGALGLASAFGAAGAGAIGFGAVATSALNDVFKANGDIQKLRDKLAKTDDEDKRAKIKKKIENATANLTKEQNKGLKSLQSFSKFWGKFAKQFQKPVMDIFSKALKSLQSILKLAEPAIQGAAKAISSLFDSLNQRLKTKDVREFFQWLGKASGPAIKAFGESFMNVFQGVMNLMVGFGPLTKDTEKGIVGLTKKFKDWTSSIKGSKGLQSFIDYVKKNGPKLLHIFGNIVGGLVGMFSAFAPLSSDMLTGLEQLTQKFEDWGKSLSKNKDFQKFIKYVRQNGPKVLDLIGNLVGLFINLASAMAPIGAKVLEIVNGIVKFTSKLAENHPVFGKIIGLFITFLGLIKLFGPPILLAQSLFGGLVGKILKGVGKLGPKIASFAETAALKFMYLGDKIKLLAGKMKTLAVTWAKKAGQMIKRAVTWAAKMVSKIVTVGAKMAWLGIKKAGAMVKKVALAFATMAKKAAIWAGKMIARFVAVGAKATAFAFKTMAKTAAKVIASFAKMSARAIIWAGKMAAQWFIAMGPIGWVIGAVVGLVVLIIANWDKVKKWTKKIFSWVWGFLKNIWHKTVGYISDKARGIWDAISDTWNDVMDFLGGINLYQIGKDIIQGLVNGIGNAATWVYDKAKEIAGGIKDTLMFWTDSHSPSKMTEKIGEYVGSGLVGGMDNMIPDVIKKAKEMGLAIKKPLTNIATGNVAMPQMADISGGAVSAGISRIEHEVNGSGANGNTTHNNFRGMMEGATFVVREDADIDRIAEALQEKYEASVRGA